MPTSSKVQEQALSKRARPKVINRINNCVFPNQFDVEQPNWSSLQSVVNQVATGNGDYRHILRNMKKYYVGSRTSTSPGFRWYRDRTWIKSHTDTENVKDKKGKPVLRSDGSILTKQVTTYEADVRRPLDQNIDHVCKFRIVQKFQFSYH